MLTFGATWCGECRAQLAHLAEMQTRYRDAGVELLAVSLDQTAKQAGELAASGAAFPVLHDSGGEVGRLYAVAQGAGRRADRSRGRRAQGVRGLSARQRVAVSRKRAGVAARVMGRPRGASRGFRRWVAWSVVGWHMSGSRLMASAAGFVLAFTLSLGVAQDTGTELAANAPAGADAPAVPEFNPKAADGAQAAERNRVPRARWRRARPEEAGARPQQGPVPARGGAAVPVEHAGRRVRVDGRRRFLRSRLGRAQARQQERHELPLHGARGVALS